jgi:large subunit ribosomal protein L21
MSDATDPKAATDPDVNPERHPDDAEVPVPDVEEPAVAQGEPIAPGETIYEGAEGAAPVEPSDEGEAEATVAAETTPPAATVTTVPVVARTVRREVRRGPKPAPAPKPLQPYAVIETGGKQYRVSVGDRISVEKLPAEAGSAITIDRVLLLGGDGTTRVGTPVVPGAAVAATVDDHFRGEKIVVFKYKAKKRYRRRLGHRQSLTRLTITGITA